jgi:predicted nucleic acid-binding protein
MCSIGCSTSWPPIRGSGRQVHDANVVATMLEHGVRRLLTFNAADFRRFARIIDIEPLP